LKPILSVLLPVHNAQAKIAGMVHRLLEVLPEITPRFEVMIVDDGSTDATRELGHDLARAYPPVTLVGHAKPIGWAPAVARQATHAAGDFLMIHCGSEIRSQDVIGLWRLHDGIAAAAKARATSARVDKNLRIDPKSYSSGNKSTVVDANRHSTSAATATNSGTLGIHARAPRSNLLLIHRQQIPELQQSLAKLPVTSWLAAESTKPKPPGSGHVKRPSFLSRVKNFTLGE
jgi:Glycosyl transferase family 2